MCKLKYLILVIIVILGLGCSKREEKGGSSASNMKLSDLSSNLKGNSLFVTVGNSQSVSIRSGYSFKRSSNRSNTNTNSLIVSDNNSNYDYGLISNYEIEIEQVIVDYTNTFAYLPLKYNGGHSDLSYDKNVRAINCTILKIQLNSNELNCLKKGIVLMGIEENGRLTRDTYAKNSFQLNHVNEIYFRSKKTFDFGSTSDLNCSVWGCLYKYNINEDSVEKIVDDTKIEVARFIALNDGQVVYTGWKLENGEIVYKGGQPVHSEIIIRDSNGKKYELTSYTGSVGGGFHHDVNAGDYKTVMFGESNIITFSRVISGSIIKTFMAWSGNPIALLKAKSGKVFLHQYNGLYQILPKINSPIVDLDSSVQWSSSNTDNCGESLNCFVFFKIFNDIVIYNKINYNILNKPTSIIAKRISDNKTLSVIKPSNDCSSNCYSINFINESHDKTSAYKLKWYDANDNLYISMKNILSGKNELIKIDINNIDFNGSDNQFSIESDISKLVDYRTTKFVSGTNNKNLNDNATAEINHVNNDVSSVQIEFNNIMNYSDVESKLSIIDNSSNSSIGFLPVWNNKTLHLVIDTDNGTSTTVESNPLTSGRTYKVTLLGSAKDADGNTLGSDVVKFITP